MRSFGGTPQGARLERIKASPRWAGERFRNLPGSPIVLQFIFTLQGSKIASLEIRS